MNLVQYNDSLYFTAATLGNLTSSKVRVVVKDVYWAQSDGYLFSQAGATPGTREFGLYRITTSGQQRLELRRIVTGKHP